MSGLGRALKRLGTFALALVIAAGSARAQNDPGVSAGGDLDAELAALLAGTDLASVPGIVLGVLREGDLIGQASAGYSDLEHDNPFTADSVVSVASMSKQFTAFAVLLLARDGALALDDDVRRFIPELPVYDEARPIRIRDLLHHTSGLRDHLTLAIELKGVRTNTDFFGLDEQLELITAQRGLCFPTGSRYQYGNTGYFLLALVVERVSGRSFRTFATDSIFRPLGMDRSTSEDDVRMVVPGRATGYNALPSGGYRITRETFPTIGCAGVLTTLRDLAKWDENFYSANVGGPWVIEQMLSSGRTDDGEPVDYGGGLFLETYSGLGVVEHGGGQEGFYARFFRFPEQGLSFIMLTNGGRPAARSARALHEAMMGLILNERFAPRQSADATETEVEGAQDSTAAPEYPPAIDLGANALGALAGRYASIEGRRRQWLEVVVDEQGPALVGTDTARHALEAEALRTLRLVASPSVRLEFDDTGRSTSFKLRQGPGRDPTEFHRIPGLTEFAQAAYAGRYVSNELDVVYTLSFESAEEIIVTLEHQAQRRLFEEPFQHFGNDCFVSPAHGNPMLEFERDEDGCISGLIFHAINLITLDFKRLR